MDLHDAPAVWRNRLTRRFAPVRLVVRFARSSNSLSKRIADEDRVRFVHSMKADTLIESCLIVQADRERFDPQALLRG